MKKSISAFIILLLTTVFSFNANAAPGDLFVQVDISIEGPNDRCSILKVMPDGSFTEFVSADSILALTGQEECDMDRTGLDVADNGDVYFSDDVSDSIIKATPSGVLSTFVSEADITAVTGEDIADPDYGLVIGPDGDVYFNDGTSDSVLKATVPGGVVSFVVTSDQITAVTGNSISDPTGGITFDCEGNLYITDQPDENDDEQDNILILTPQGDLSIFVSEQEINAATGFDETQLDSGMTFFDSLFVLDDGNCECVLKITLDGDISVFIPEDDITDVTGNGGADLDGGIAINQGREVFIGDSGDDPDDSNLLKSPPSGSSVSLFITTQELENFYPGFEPGLDGSMAFEGVNACLTARPIPTLSEWGLITMAGILGLVGFMVMRRRREIA